MAISRANQAQTYNSPKWMKESLKLGHGSYESLAKEHVVSPLFFNIE